MALQLSVNLDGCTGCACCMMECPNLFDIDDASGKAILIEARPVDDLLEEAERAVRSCPENVITLRQA
jgi:ferredoxin